ncbi:hypothetical protein V2J09_010168 [Rumex salicifolius]
MWCRCFFFIIIIITVSYVSATSAARAQSSASRRPPLFPAIYVFGDSLVDPGNNNHLMTKPSPRLGWLTGFNYASSLCGILKETSSNLRGGCFNLHQQVGFFESTVNQVLKTHYTNSKDLSRHLSKSLFVFVIGSNDYINNYFSSFYPDSKKYTPKQFADLLLSQVSHQLQRVYWLGARKAIFSEISPIGCMTIEHKRHGKCNETKNDIVSEFNKGLEPLLSNLTSKLPGSMFVAAKTNKLTLQISNNPSKYGFVNCKEPCCESVFDGYLKCKRGRKPCNNRSQYCFWDPHHPTEAVTRLVVAACFNDDSMCSIRKLLKG